MRRNSLPNEFLIKRGRCGVHGADRSDSGLGGITLIGTGGPAARPRCLGLFRPGQTYARIMPPTLLRSTPMAKDPFEQFAIPNEMRSFAEQSVAQARKAFDGFME